MGLSRRQERCPSKYKGWYTQQIYQCALAKGHKGGVHTDIPGIRGLRWNDKEAYRESPQVQAVDAPAEER